jgi:DNA-directed RNA polymerase subunit RPC12/RpoP
MARETDAGLSPDEAFSALGNEIRVSILRVLAEADGPLPFSEVYGALDVDDSAQFNYHLDKLVGHFVGKTDEGYTLRRPGRRVVEAILSGAVTEAPQLDRTSVDGNCSYCGSRIEVQWRESSIELFCTECDGAWDRSWGRAGGPQPVDDGYLGRLPMPPAGLEARSPTEAYCAAWIWTNLEVMAAASGICPRCSARLETSIHACESHDADGEVCADCESRFAVRAVFECDNCNYTTGGSAALALLTEDELLSFMTDQGLNPVAPESIHRVDRTHTDYEEEVLSTDPLEVGFTFTVDGGRLTLRVDEDLEVVEASR